jgi:hypothetical protein
MTPDQQEPGFFPASPPTEEVDPLLQELEESIPQGVPNDTGFRRRASDTEPDIEPLDALDALLAESVEQAEAAARYKRDREAAKRNFVGMSKEEIEFCNTRMRAFELAREWDADDCIAIFKGYVCGKCDKSRVVFSRLMEHHQHRRVATTHRWVMVKESKLAPRTVYEEVDVPMCMDCVEEYGMAHPLADETPWLEDVLNGDEVESENV